MPNYRLCVVALLLHVGINTLVGTYSNAPISEISLPVPSLFESALPPALPGSHLMVPGTNLGHPGLTVRWCNSAGPCVQLKPVFADTASVAIRVPGGGATVASVTPCYATSRQEAVKSAGVGEVTGNTCGPTLFGINAPKVSWIAAEGELLDCEGDAKLPGTVSAGTVLHLLGRSLAWNGTRCDSLKAPPESSSYSALRNAVYQLQTADRHRGSYTQQVASVQAALQRLDPPMPHLDNVRTTANVTVSLRGDDGTEIALDLPLISCFRVDAMVPMSVVPGHYVVALGNGLAPPLNVGTLLVAAPKAWPSKVFVPGEHCTNISACLAVAIAAGGGTVQLPAGIVNMSLDDALAISNNVTLRGAGAGQTILSWDSHWSPSHCNGVSATGEVCGCHDDGGDIELACTDSAATISTVNFASIGTPSGDCGNFTVGKCSGDPTKAKAAVEAACLGKQKCSITCDIGHLNGGADPCYGVPKRVRVSVTCSKSPARVALDAGTKSPPALISCSGDAKIVGLTVRSSLRLPLVGIAFEPGSADCVIESSNIEIDAQDYAITNAFTAVSSTSFVVRGVNIVHNNGGQVCGSWPSQCAIFIATSSRGIVENTSVIASCSGYSIDSSQSLFLDRVATVSIGNVSSEGQGFSSFRAPQLVEHIYQGRGVDVGNTFASWVDTTNPNHKNSQGRNEAMTLDGPYGLYLGLVDKTALSSDGCCQTLHTASPPPFAMPGRIAAVGAAAIIMQGYGIGMVSRVTAISADLRTPRHFPITDHLNLNLCQRLNSYLTLHRPPRVLAGTYTISPPFEQPLDRNSSVLSIVSFRGRSIWEGNAYLNATAFQLFGTSLDVVSAGNYFDNSTSGMQSFGLYYQGGWQPNFDVLFEENTMQCTGIDPPFFFRFGVGLGTNSLGYVGCRICREPPISFDAPYNRMLHFRSNTLGAGTPMKILGRTENCVLDKNVFVAGTCGNGQASQAGNLTIDNATTRAIVVT